MEHPVTGHKVQRNRSRARRVLVTLAGLAILGLAACTASPAPLAPSLPGTPTRTPFQPLPWTLTPASLPATQAASPTAAAQPADLIFPTEAPTGEAQGTGALLYLDPRLQAAVLSALQVPPSLVLSDDPNAAALQLVVGEQNVVSRWVYALVTPFATVVDGIAARDLLAAWKGNGGGDFAGAPLMMDAATLGVLSAYWGQPAEGAVEVRSPEKLLQAAWDRRPSWAILPFEQLNPQWKVLAVDGISPIHKDFDLSDYELAIPISLTGTAAELPTLPASNRDPAKMTVLAMTGVTALVRATAFTMEQRGVTYPASDIGPLLRAADITHVSNEVPFAADCPYPNPVQEGVRFCSREQYIGLLEEVGTDVVELTGDHFADWGAQAMLFTLDLYEERGWYTYGGGATFDKGKRAALIEHNGNRLAFIGCNAKGGGFATASANNPGAVACDWEWMQKEIRRLRAEDYLPIVTFQHFEYYTYLAQPNQVNDAGRMSEAGAVIVSGSQAHQPQAFEFVNGAFVHHGLGNLFFDQLDVSEATRQGLIDLHIFYGGRHISSELVSIYFVDYARARLMTVEERSALLMALFSASGW